ncbi:MAG: ornithine cyclodeaminase [Thermofilaceae archaeon]|nr:ornithine cyclodeaminase [Thermofilaceae archaeon]MCX8180070.1 ornithine cyclodeaminase [Thermofilaceae archaeon]MDW8003188.1 ornithine cyclodeaminase [Thermofilaceae archaeon]
MHLKLLTAEDVSRIVKSIGVENFLDNLIARVEVAFANWKQLKVVPRVSFSYASGVLEVMPASDSKWYTVKIVNGHPLNPSKGLSTVVALGILADVETGYPVMVADATLLTAFRTGASSAVATKYLARSDSETLGILGTGAQSEFLCLAVSRVIPLKRIFYYDIDPSAMKKFKVNMMNFGFELVEASNAREVAEQSDVLVTATAAKGRCRVVERNWVRQGVHINAVGGDSPGKTELDPRILTDAKVVVELLEQALVEGEVQNTGRETVYAELWELVSGLKPGRVDDEEITVFDSVGIAVEDWAAITYLYDLATELGVGLKIDFVPSLRNPKDLFSLVALCQR